MSNAIDKEYLTSQFNSFAAEVKDRFHLKGDEPFVMVNRHSLLPTPTNSCIAYVLNTETIEDIQNLEGFYIWDNTVVDKSWEFVASSSSAISTISVNNSKINPDQDKNINITMPTDISDLTNNDEYIRAIDYGTIDKGGSFKPDGTTLIVQDGVASANMSNIINDTTTDGNKVFSSNYVNANYTKQSDVLKIDNTSIYTPSGDYHPATKKYVDDAISSLNGIMELKGRIDTSAELPSSAENGNVYYVGAEGSSSFSMYVKLEDGNWLCIGDTSVDLSEIYTKTEVDDLLKTKVGIISTLPTASVEYVNYLYFCLTDNKFYKCILISGTYSWIIVSSSDDDSIIHKGNTIPEDTNSLWVDTSDTSNILIKTYNSTTSTWKTLNDIPKTYVKSVEENNGSIVITKSDNDTTTISIEGGGGVSDYGDLENRPKFNGSIIEGNKDGASYGLMDESVYKSTTNEGYVKNSDKAISLETFDNEPSPLQYYGTDSSNTLGKHSFPINTENDNTIIQQRIFENVTSDFNTTIDSLTDVNNKAIVQVWKEMNGEENVSTTIRNYNEMNKTAYNSSDFVTFTDTNCNISKEKTWKPQADLATETYSFDFSKYIEIESIESEVTE